MELRAFAERVLFSTALEDKLCAPGTVTDECPGNAIVVPAMPGRPKALIFKPKNSGKSEFPGMHRLEGPEERGRLLHFFANHELLATELMALVLLRFPDAPAAFRKGVLRTLQDEQQHTRLYIQRMRECGIEFGELPVNGYFWRCVSTMDNPIDYVASLCLTFEQANLDFARHFARGFSKLGDEDTAKLLERIYRDEIGHVAYGLKWFRRWKNPNESDWEAFCRTLKFPLSPQRAKGFSLNVEGRRAAGLDEHFIAELNAFSQSKGRTPNVFVFNALAEGRIAQGKTFNPTKHQAQLAQDLEHLPMFLCRQDDVVLVRHRPSVEFLSRIKQAGILLPEFVELPERGSANRANPSFQVLSKRKLGQLRPWAWSPDSVQLLAPLSASLTNDKRTAAQRFNADIAQLYSKAWSADFLRNHLRETASGTSPCPTWLCTANEVGQMANTLDAALGAVSLIHERGHHRVVVKEAVGLAGSNAIRLFEPKVLETHKRWMANKLERGQQLVIEPWLERLVDFSVQLEMTCTGLKLCGYTLLLTDAKGQYQGNLAESHHHTRMPTRVVACFVEPPDISRLLLQFYSGIFRRLESELLRVDYLGPLGVDAFVFRDALGASRLKPIVEINPRYTMGRVAVELMKQTCQGSFGLFRLVNHAAIRAQMDNFADYAKRMRERFPLQLDTRSKNTRLREGFLCLSAPDQAGVCLATFQVARDSDALLRASRS